MLTHWLMMSLMKACKLVGKEAFTTKELQEWEVLIKEILNNTTDLMEDTKLQFLAVEAVEDQWVNMDIGKGNKWDRLLTIVLISLEEVDQTILTEDKVEQLAEGEVHLTLKDKEVEAALVVQYLETTIKAHQELVKTLVQIHKITRWTLNNNQIKIIISNIDFK